MSQPRPSVTSLHRLGWLLALLGAMLGSVPAAAFDFGDVDREAAALARNPYRAPPPPDPALAALSYDDYRRIRFRPEQALWRGTGSAFEAHFFPLGRGNSRALRLFEVADGRASPLTVPATAFSFDNGPPPANGVAGAAGWRLSFPLNDGARRDELIVFLGASYFRALAAGLRYGVSARGVAIDTVGGRGEEFPNFTTFWLERPPPGAREAIFYALLDGPRVSGAYRFAVRPGNTTVVEVQARLYLRGPVAMLGIAPLTSMYLMGENQPVADDYRPEVHDSDGLQIETGDGEWIWRPLVNPRQPFVTSFAGRTVRGFGLLQRDRAFGSYEDLEARYELRPSVWVEPVGDWGPGRVELLQFGTPDETHDNVAAYWVPQNAPSPGVPLELSWRLHWSGDALRGPPASRVLQTRRGHGYRESKLAPGQLQFHLDFSPTDLTGSGGAEAVEVVASANDNVRALRALAYPNEARGGWRVTIDLERIDPARPVELRAFLRHGARVLSETWAYALPPE
jgi:glucans biosynthesis protein